MAPQVREIKAVNIVQSRRRSNSRSESKIKSKEREPYVPYGKPELSFYLKDSQGYRADMDQDSSLPNFGNIRQRSNSATKERYNQLDGYSQ